PFLQTLPFRSSTTGSEQTARRPAQPGRRPRRRFCLGISTQLPLNFSSKPALRWQVQNRLLTDLAVFGCRCQQAFALCTPRLYFSSTLTELPCLTHLTTSNARALTLTKKSSAAAIWASSATSRSTTRPTNPVLLAAKLRN